MNIPWSRIFHVRQLLLIRQGVGTTAGTAVNMAIEDALIRLSPVELAILYRRLVNA